MCVCVCVSLDVRAYGVYMYVCVVAWSLCVPFMCSCAYVIIVYVCAVGVCSVCSQCVHSKTSQRACTHPLVE